MRHVIAIGLVLSKAAGAQIAPSPVQLDRLEAELRGVTELLRVSGVSAAVFSGDSVVWRFSHGVSDTARRTAVAPDTRFPIASISKTMAAVVTMQLADSGRLTLDDTVGRFLPDLPDVAGVRIRNLLAHTSEGTPGEIYLYSGSRYGLIGRIAAAAAGGPYADVLRRRLFEPLHMRHTVAPAGVTSASGVVSTVDDLARYASALHSGRLVSPRLLEQMWTPVISTTGRSLPYGLGWFVQSYAGEQIVWHYGQDDDAGSLLLYLPERRLGFVMLTTSGSMSDAFRLLDGNVARSLPANAFLRAVLGDREVLVRDAIVDSALAQLYVDDVATSTRTLRRAIVRYPDIARAPDLPTFYLIVRLRDPVADSAGNAMLPRLLETHPRSPMPLYFAAAFYGRTNREAESISMFERIGGLSNPPRHWSVVLGLTTLAEKLEVRDPARARRYADRVVAMNYNFGGAVDRARALLARLP